MKSINRIFIACLLRGAFSSCKKQLLDINTDPNNPTTASASPDLVLSNALNTSAGIYDNSTAGNNNFVWSGLWLGHIGYSGNYAIATENISYNLTNSFAAGTWDNIYDNIEDYDFVEKKGAASGNTFYQAIGMLMKAYNFETLVDLYNNIPYSQALQGTGNGTPAYDDAKTVYDDLGKKMDTAIAIFGSSAAASTISGDIMFGGDASKWLLFANTVKLDYLLRQSEKNAAEASAQAAQLSGGFISEDATVNPGYLNSSGKMNPFWGSNVNVSNTYTQTLYRAGGYGVQNYIDNADPRLAAFYSPNGNGDYQGNYFGDQGAVNSVTSGIGPGVLQSFDQSAVIMLAAQSYFLQAEAVLRGWIPGHADSLYMKGVEASFAYLGLTQADAQAYYSQPTNKQTNWAATTNFDEQLALIIRQKWAAEAWVNEKVPYDDYRRLHLPADIPLSTSPFSTGIFPQRLMYPQREINVNGANVQAQGNITPGSKVWWIP